ncbi:MAG: hypothetical protein ABJJ69_15465 [Paracoccaceae bacterium]
MSAQTHRIMWQSIEIEAVYDPLKWNVIAHLEIRSINPERAPLPITETGYLSHFHQPGTMEANEGTLVEQIILWLDERAKQPHWQRHLEATRQGELF